jgi:hypothetical protein
LLLLLEPILGFFIAKFLEPVWLLLLNAFSTQQIPFDIFGAFLGLISIVLTTAIAVYLIIKFTKHPHRQTVTVEDYLDDLIIKLQAFKHRWNWGIPFWSKGYKRQIPRRVISHKKVRNHATEIRRAIRSLREHLPGENTKIPAVLASLDTIIDSMVDFSTELENTFDILNVNDIPADRLKELVSAGEEIRERISRHLDSLDKLRGTLA